MIYILKRNIKTDGMGPFNNRLLLFITAVWSMKNETCYCIKITILHSFSNLINIYLYHERESVTHHSNYIFIIHPCDPTVVICYLIRPCDIAVCITYLISHNSSLIYNLKIFQFGCIINIKIPSCDDIIRRTSLGFPSWCPESTRPTDSVKNLMMYGRLYQHTRVVLYILYHRLLVHILKLLAWVSLWYCL